MLFIEQDGQHFLMINQSNFSTSAPAHNLDPPLGIAILAIAESKAGFRVKFDHFCDHFSRLSF